MSARPAGGQLWTIGHSTREWPVFVEMLQAADIGCVVDVRRFAGSRRNPQYAPAAMAPALQEAGIAYVAEPDLGGRRVPRPDSPNGAWRVAAFRGYADYMASDAFRLARERLMQQADATRCAVMCAEALWWRCHRRLIADDVVARGGSVEHLMSPGKQQAHVLHPDARLVGDVLVYPPGGVAQAGLFGSE